MKNFILKVTALIFLFSVCFSLVSCVDKDESAESVTAELFVSCETVLSHPDLVPAGLKDFVPADGVILQKSAYETKGKESVFAFTIRIAKENDIAVTYKSELLVGKYVESIAHIAEKSVGGQSGWMIVLNGEALKNSSDKTFIADGDKVEWLFSVKQGDLGLSV